MQRSGGHSSSVSPLHRYCNSSCRSAPPRSMPSDSLQQGKEKWAGRSSSPEPCSGPPGWGSYIWLVPGPLPSPCGWGPAGGPAWEALPAARCLPCSWSGSGGTGAPAPGRTGARRGGGGRLLLRPPPRLRLGVVLRVVQHRGVMQQLAHRPPMLPLQEPGVRVRPHAAPGQGVAGTVLTCSQSSSSCTVISCPSAPTARTSRRSQQLHSFPRYCKESVGLSTAGQGQSHHPSTAVARAGPRETHKAPLKSCPAPHNPSSCVCGSQGFVTPALA